MTARFVIVLAAAWGIFVSGCRNKLAPVPNADIAIFDVVLSDLIGNKDIVPRGFSPVVEPFQIVVDDKTRAASTLITLLDNTRGNPAWKVPLDIRTDLKRRNRKGTSLSLAHYHPATPNILVRDLDKIDQGDGFFGAFPDAACYVKPWLPGYSPDGQSALFYFFVGPSVDHHGCLGYYLVKKVDGHWEIVWRYIGYVY